MAESSIGPTRVLVVDDQKQNVRLLEMRLRAHGYQVDAAYDGESALGLVQERLPDLILLDVMMPGMDGYEVCRHLQSMPTAKYIPVIMLTAKGDLESKVTGLEVGAVDYMTKPFEPQELLARVGAALRAKRVRDEALEAAWHDPLTSLYSRRYLDQRLTDEFRRSVRYDTPFSMVMIDIDHFKKINDTLGHAAGDEVLIAVGRALKDQCRDVDKVCRYGGEEFAILLPETDLAGASMCAERLRRQCEELAFSGNLSCVSISVSCGVSSYPEAQAASAQELLEQADGALYEAKNAGRNRTVPFLTELSDKEAAG